MPDIGDAPRKESLSVHEAGAQVYGWRSLYFSKVRRFLATRHLAWHLLTRGQFRDLHNLVYTKVLVPGGEGTAKAAFPVWGPLVRGFPALAPFPRYVEIEVTTICDKDCVFCEHTHWPLDAQERRNLKYEEFVHIVDQFPTLRWANLTGEGSSFLNRDYPRMLRYLRERHHTSIYLVDHFSDVNEETIRLLVDIGINGVYLSIDGATAQTYERIKVGCKWDNVVTNIRRLIAYKRQKRTPLPELCFRFVITHDNVHEMPAFVDFVNALGTPADLGYTAQINFTGLLHVPEIEHMFVRELPREVVDGLQARRGKGVPVVLDHAVAELLPPPHCCECWLEPYIMMGGYVLPCCGVLMSNKRPFLRQHAFGNVLQGDMKEIWNSPRYRAFRRMLMNPKAPVPIMCAGCRAFNTTPRMKRYGVSREI